MAAIHNSRQSLTGPRATEITLPQPVNLPPPRSFFEAPPFAQSLDSLREIKHSVFQSLNHCRLKSTDSMID